MTITAEGGEPAVVAAQKEAIKAKVGMWAHGVPKWIMTSLHSTAEGGGRSGKTENRLVSTEDGHSMKWRHTDSYGECEKVCQIEKTFAPADVATVAEKTAAEAGDKAKALIAKIGPEEMALRVTNFLNYGHVGWMDTSEDAELLTSAIDDAAAEVSVKPLTEVVDTCQVYIDFRRRYGSKRASCLK
jgi:hypothetical protein